MANKMDMSLDDIIKQNRTQRGRGRGERRSPQSGRRRGGQDRRGGGNSGVYSGGVNRRRGRGGSTSTFNERTREVPDVWEHDLFDGNSGPAQKYDRSPSSTAGSGKLLVSNLDFSVSNSDIEELFSEFGPLVKAAIHFDRSGRSLGTAEVIYQRNASAVKAMKQYNNVPLDGRPMSIRLLGGAASSSSSSRSVNSRLGPRVEDNKAPQSRGNSSFRGGNRGGRGRDKKLPTVEDLDAQLDAYNAKMDVD